MFFENQDTIAFAKAKASGEFYRIRDHLATTYGESNVKIEGDTNTLNVYFLEADESFKPIGAILMKPKWTFKGLKGFKSFTPGATTVSEKNYQ